MTRLRAEGAFNSLRVFVSSCESNLLTQSHEDTKKVFA